MAKQHVLSKPGELRLLIYNECPRKFISKFLMNVVLYSVVTISVSNGGQHYSFDKSPSTGYRNRFP